MRRIGLMVLLAGMVTTPVAAEELIVDTLRELNESSPVEIPRGRTKAEVEDRHGEPKQIKGPVGDPPITRWMYDDYTVYFETERVIHTVIRR